MKNPQISVIVPVYNAEKYLPVCIDSILAQKNPNFEVIIVDDGSKDNSEVICEEYARKDNRIRLFRKTNGGVSSARNLALLHANGSWLAFVDADDIIDENYLTIANNDADIIVKSYNMSHEDGSIVKINSINHDKLLTNVDDFYKIYVRNRQNALWNKLISRRIVSDTKFKEGVNVGEDFLFFLSCLSRVRSVFFSATGCYTYFLREGSAMNQVYEAKRKRLDILLENISNIKEITSKQHLDNLGNNIIACTYITYIGRLRELLSKEEKLYVRDVISEISLRRLSYLTFKQKIKYLKASFLLHL